MVMDADGYATRRLPDKTGSLVPEPRKGSVLERAPADREFLSANGGREGFAILRCRRKLRALQPPLRRISLPGLLKSQRCATIPELAPARAEPWPAFRASRTAPRVKLRNPSNPALDSCLLLPRLSKLVAGDGANTSADDSGPVERRCDKAMSSTSCLGGTREFRERRAGKLPGSHLRHRRNPREYRKPGCTPLRDNR